jgi:hypothetical protein
MKLISTSLLVGFVCFAIGIWYGYDRGVKNHLYYDAPARIALYDAYLEEGDLVEHIEGEIWYQIGLLDGMKDSALPVLLNHPIHVGVEDAFLEHRSKIEDSKRIQRIRDEIKAYNKNKH